MKTFDLDTILQDLTDNYGEGSDDLVVVEDGDWVQEHKYQYKSTVYKHEPTGRFVAYHQSRSGSYHSDWYYDDPSINEVWPITETIVRTTYVHTQPMFA